MSTPSRRVRKHDVPTAIREILQGVCAAELVRPSKTVWLVSAWVSDTVVLDNSSGAFSGLDPSWSEAPVRLVRFLTTLAQRGTVVHVATNATEHNDDVCRRLERRAREGLPICVHRQDRLHEKGLLTDRFFLCGSMNFTHNGIHAEGQSEAVELIVESHRLSEERLSFMKRWGDES